MLFDLLDAQGDERALVSKFEGIADEVVDDLFHLGRIEQQGEVCRAIVAQAQLDAAVGGIGDEGGYGAGEEGKEMDRFFVEGEFIGFYLRQIQQFFDQGEEFLGVALDRQGKIRSAFR